MNIRLLAIVAFAFAVSVGAQVGPPTYTSENAAFPNPAFVGSGIFRGLSYPSVTITHGGTPASSPYTYAVVGTDVGGKTRAQTGSTATGAVTLTVTDTNIITVAAWSNVSPDILPVGACDVYRTAGGATQGLIGAIPSCAAGGNLHDTGLVGNAASPPTDTSGVVTFSGPLLFMPDNSFDIGRNSASRARDFYLGRHFVGNGDIRIGAGNFLYFNGRSGLMSEANGLLTLFNNAQTDFTRLRFGGTTALFPSIKRNGTALNFRLADDSADAPITSGIDTAWATISAGTKFTISGCSAGTTVGGAAAGTFASGTTGVCTVVITINGATGVTAPTGWACDAADRTTPADLVTQTASTANTATLSGNTISGDVISFKCVGY
jgi:hypothetical protein